MAVRLDAWLEETFATQLLLGNHWLQEKHEKKASGIKTEHDRAWEGLYHDNGSCLDVSNYIHPERNSALQVLQTRPFTLTDGHHHIVAHPTPDCTRDFATRYPAVSCLGPGSTIAIRQYTIRHTSYGPPQHRLRFLLHRIDWLGTSYRAHGTRQLSYISYKSAIGAVLQQLRETRAREDRRCLAGSEAQDEEDDTMPSAMDEGHDAYDSDASTASQMPYTQPIFSTQIQHPIRARADPDEPQVIGTKSLEPILAGNTRREEISSASATREHLLSLLAKEQKPKPASASPSHSRGFVQSAFARQNSADNVTKPAESSTDSPNQHATRSGISHDSAQDVLTSPKPKEGLSKEVSSPLARDEDVAEPAPAIGDDGDNVVPPEDVPVMPECSWMEGMPFNSEAFKVPRLQEECLNKDSSWFWPPPGCPPFQDGNMPQLILQSFHRMADEMATEKERVSEAESDVDPSPDSLPEGINLSAESVPQTTQDDDDSDHEIPWSSSPGPRSPGPRPQVPTAFPQGLPPDSSAETHASDAEQSRTKLTPLGKQPQYPSAIDVSDDEAADPASSLPAAQAPVDSDDEMEMEEFIPQALGEDLADSASPSMKRLSISSSRQTRPQSVVQVEETPYGKGKTANYMEGVQSSKLNSEQAQNSSGESKHTSSKSIIYSTYDMPEASSSAEISQSHTKTSAGSEEQRSHQQREQTPDKVPQDPIAQSSAGQGPVGHIPEDIPMLDEPFDERKAVEAAGVKRERQRSEALPTKKVSTVPAATTPQPDVPPPEKTNPKTPSAMPHTITGSTKRKLDISPAKSSRRHSKRREIKIVGFGDASPVAVDPVAKLREEREESLRRFREQRNSSASFESRPEPTRAPTAEHDTDVMDLDRPDTSDHGTRALTRSPRHQSLYDDPSPRPARFTQPRQSQPAQNEAQSRREIQSSKAKSHSTQNAQANQADQQSPLTIFESFKAAYPEYKGDTKHFHNQCKQIYLLDLEDKMVPKWQWDDFIIRNRTDYRDYAMECLDRGETAEPYHRFYKDNIRDTLYRKGIVESRKTLEKALGEVGIAIKDLITPTEPPRTQLSSRKSLPSTFGNVRKPHQDHIAASHTRPRQSLPPSSRSNHRHQEPSPSVSRYASPRQQHKQPKSSRDPSPAPPPPDQEPTGDPFRDFFFGFQRSTSFTGSTKVDPTKPWPRNLEGRPSIEDIPRKKVDVLEWGDVLGEKGK